MARDDCSDKLAAACAHGKASDSGNPARYVSTSAAINVSPAPVTDWMETGKMGWAKTSPSASLPQTPSRPCEITTRLTPKSCKARERSSTGLSSDRPVKAAASMRFGFSNVIRLNHAIHVGELGMSYVYLSDASSDSDSSDSFDPNNPFNQ